MNRTITFRVELIVQGKGCYLLSIGVMRGFLSIRIMDWVLRIDPFGYFVSGLWPLISLRREMA